MIQVSKKRFHKIANIILIASLCLALMVIPIMEYYNFKYISEFRIISVIIIMLGGIFTFNLRIEKEKELEDHLIE